MGKASDAAVRRHIEKVGKDYNAITAGEDYRHYLTRRRDILKGLLEARTCPDYIVVDLASGTGNYAADILRCKRLLNLDLSINALREQQDLDRKIARVNADALHIPLKDDSVDCVLLVGLLHHIPAALDRAFGEVARVLRKGGLAIIDEANAYNLAWFVMMRLSEIDRIGTRPLFPYALRKLAKAHGLAVEKERYWGFVPPGIGGKNFVDAMSRIEAAIERSFLSRICTRYLLVLKK